MMIEMAVVVPVIVGLVEVIKSAGLPSRVAPLISIILGMVVFFFMGEGEMMNNIFEGIVAGLSASGLYSGGRAVMRGE